jgi:hypothetical protein
MRPRMDLALRARQRGWVGLIVILVALVIVAILAKDALKKYGLAPGATVTTKAGTPAERARAPGAGGIEALDLGSAPAAPASALERARGVEGMVKQQAGERAARGDGVTR